MAKRQTQGAVLQLLLFAACLIFNWFAAGLPESYEDDGFFLNPIPLAIGVLFAEIAIVSIWLVLGSTSLFQRVCFYVFVTVPLFASLLLGYLQRYSRNESVYEWDVSEIYSAIAVFQALQTGMVLPMIVIHWCGFSVRSIEPDLANPKVKRNSGHFSIISLLAATTFAACFFMSQETAGFLHQENVYNRLFYYGVITLFAAVLSLALVCPMVGLLGKNFTIGNLVALPLITGLIAIVRYGYETMTGEFQSLAILTDGDSRFMTAVLLAQFLVLALYLASLRLSGFALAKRYGTSKNVA